MRKTLAAILLLPALALADSSFQTIGYQGLLKKSDGTPETQTVQVTFRIFAAATGGTALWSEVQDVTPNSGGFYAVFLGSQTAFPSTLFDGSDRYLELQIQGDSTALTPRQQIGSVPYALTAKNVNGGTTGTVTTGSVNATNISVSGPVTASGGVTGLPTPSAASDAARKDMGGATLNNLGTPSAPGDAATKSYVDKPYTVSSSSGYFSTTSQTWVDVPHLSVSITTQGRPVVLGCASDGTDSGFLATLTAFSNSLDSCFTEVRLLRDGSPVAYYSLWGSAARSTNVGFSINAPSSVLRFFDIPPAGTHTYQLQVQVFTGSQGAQLNYTTLYAYEI